MNKLVVAMPLFYNVAVPFFTRWMHMDHRPQVGFVTVNGAYITTACETIVREAMALLGSTPDCPIQGGPTHYTRMPTTTSPADYATREEESGDPTTVEWDRLVILEHDVLAPLDALVRIAHYAPEHDIVGSMIFEHNPPHPAMVFIDRPDGSCEPITPDTVTAWCDDPMLYRCGATSFGLISIARHVLENWDKNTPMFGIDHNVGSHDLWFCRKARDQGFKVYVDSGMVCEHLTSVPIGITHNQSAPLPKGIEVREFAYSEA